MTSLPDRRALRMRDGTMRFSRRDFLRTSSLTSAAAALAPGFAGLLRTADSDTAARCRKLAADPLRPQYHLLPDHNWMNDPNGPIFYRGKYHMFHQYNPKGAVWGNMHWAHATSPDMIHWQHEGIALAPTPGGPDQDGVFSGSAVLDNGRPTIIYTGVARPAAPAEATLRDGQHVWRETQCLAVAQDDDLRVWKKLPQPVIAAPPAGMEVTGFRDPCLWREGDRWMLILGSGIRGKGGMILLYSSPDLRNWTYLHPLVEGDASGKDTTNPVDTGDMWECPDFFPLGKKHVLLISTMGKVRWKAGTYADQKFHPEKEGVVDWGSYYAAKTMLDKDGNRILWGWIPEARPDSELIKAGWAGVMSLPRVMSLSSANEFQTEVAPAAGLLRSQHIKREAGNDIAATRTLFEAARVVDLAAEIDFLLRPKADDLTIHLLSDGGEFVSISCVKRSGYELRVGNVTAPLAAMPMRLHMFLDGSVLEVFVNDGIAVTARVYQVPSGPLRVKIEGDAEVTSLDIWQMNPISKDRLTGSMCS